MSNNGLYSLCWTFPRDSLWSLFNSFRTNELMVDVSLAASDGQTVRAHKLILCAASPFFKNILINQIGDKEPIIFLNDVSISQLKCLLSFIYNGEVKLPQKELSEFLNICHILKLRGLSTQETNLDNTETTTTMQEQQQEEEYTLTELDIEVEDHNPFTPETSPLAINSKLVNKPIKSRDIIENPLFGSSTSPSLMPIPIKVIKKENTQITIKDYFSKSNNSDLSNNSNFSVPLNNMVSNKLKSDKIIVNEAESKNNQQASSSSNNQNNESSPYYEEIIMDEDEEEDDDIDDDESKNFKEVKKPKLSLTKKNPDRKRNKKENSSGVKRAHKKWNLIKHFENELEAKSSIEGQWSIDYTNTVSIGKKVYYYCKQGKKSCPAALQLLFRNDDAKVEMFLTSNDHNHNNTNKKIEIEYVIA